MKISYSEAILIAQKQILIENDKSLVLGINVSSPDAVFGTVKNLIQEFGSNRVIETPASENAVTGICIGLATAGYLPILVHQRMDFAILSFDMIINQLAKWNYMYGDQLASPVIIRMIIGRGWGQGPQHSQALHNFLVHVPGLQVFLPANAQEVYSTLMYAANSKTPTIIFEHRWLYNQIGTVDLNQKEPQPTREITFSPESEITVVSISFSTIDALRAVKILRDHNVKIDLYEISNLHNLDLTNVLKSIAKTKKLLVIDIGHEYAGAASTIITEIVIRGAVFESPPRILGLKNYPTPTAASLAKDFYPRAIHIVNSILEILELNFSIPDPDNDRHLDTPDDRFIGYY